MPRKFLRRISRQYRVNQSAWYLKPFRAVLGQPRYFALNRRSVSRALAIGLFISMLPVPGHTPLAVLVALLMGANLGVAALAAWINSPLTLVPVVCAEYRLGAWLLGRPAQPWPESFDWAWLQQQMALLWQPLALGALVAATATTTVAYVIVNAVWRWSSARRLRRRQRLARKDAISRSSDR